MLVDQRLGQATFFPDGAGVNRWPVLGLWMVDQECCGMGIREDAGPITGNLSSFVPHLFR
jgi:glutathionylspermidine synthase